MKNIEIRKQAQKNNIYLWQIAEKLNISDSNFSRKLRKEFTENEKKNILNIIDELVKEGE